MSKNRSGQGKKKRSRNKSSRNKKSRAQAKKNIEVLEEKSVETEVVETTETLETTETTEISEPNDYTVGTDDKKESETTKVCDTQNTEEIPDETQDETQDEAQEETHKNVEQSKPEEIPEETQDESQKEIHENIEQSKPEDIPKDTQDDAQEETHENVEQTEPEHDEHEQVDPDEPVQKTVHYAQASKIKKHRTGLKVFAVMVMLIAYSAAFVSGAFAVERYVVSPDKFHNGIIINGVDVSGMNVDQAKKALTKEWNKHSITIVDRNGSEIGKIKDFDFSYKIKDQLEAVMKPGAEKAIARFISRENSEVTINMKPVKNTKSFNKQYQNLDMVKHYIGDKPSKNAYIDKTDTEFRIVKEVIGNSVDTKMLRKAILEAIARGEDTFEYRRESFYKPPEIVSTSQVLLDELEYCKNYLSFKIHLRNSVGDYTITPDWLDKMMKVEKDGKTKIVEESINQFISDVLYPKFSSTGDTRTLKSAGGGKYTVSGGTYGFTVDVDKERDVITKELKDREDVEREPYYSGKKPNKNGTSDIGNDFVEVSIEKQRVWVVKGGKVIVDTPVVTGNVPRHNTPTGVYYIVYKATNTTLKGHNDDGSEYESHVAYWMPFYLGYGLHDASWRGVFGGSIYIGNGSHGCVNCPPAVMPKIFSECYEGMPVIVH